MNKIYVLVIAILVALFSYFRNGSSENENQENSVSSSRKGAEPWR